MLIFPITWCSLREWAPQHVFKADAPMAECLSFAFLTCDTLCSLMEHTSGGRRVLIFHPFHHSVWSTNQQVWGIKAQPSIRWCHLIDVQTKPEYSRGWSCCSPTTGKWTQVNVKKRSIVLGAHCCRVKNLHCFLSCPVFGAHWESLSGRLMSEKGAELSAGT